MRYAIGVFAFIALLVCGSWLFAQTPVDPSGHWTGSIAAPFGEIQIEVDIVRKPTGELTGTFSQPAQNVRGLPLRHVTLDGRAISFAIKAGEGGGGFQGIVFEGDRSIAGDVASPLGTAPFTLTRTGEAIVDPPIKSAAVGKEFEGRWHGALELNGRQLRVVLTVANHADGTATGSILSLDEDELDIPVSLAPQARTLTLGIRMTGASYSGTLDAGSTELTGTYTQGPVTLPLVFRRVSP